MTVCMEDAPQPMVYTAELKPAAGSFFPALHTSAADWYTLTAVGLWSQANRLWHLP